MPERATILHQLPYTNILSAFIVCGALTTACIFACQDAWPQLVLLTMPLLVLSNIAASPDLALPCSSLLVESALASSPHFTEVLALGSPGLPWVI